MSLGFASDETTSDNDRGDPIKPQMSLAHIYPAGYSDEAVDGTDEEVDHYANQQVGDSKESEEESGLSKSKEVSRQCY